MKSSDRANLKKIHFRKFFNIWRMQKTCGRWAVVERCFGLNGNMKLPSEDR